MYLAKIKINGELTCQDGGQLNKGYEILYSIKCIEKFEAATRYVEKRFLNCVFIGKVLVSEYCKTKMQEKKLILKKQIKNIAITI